MPPSDPKNLKPIEIHVNVPAAQAQRSSWLDSFMRGLQTLGSESVLTIPVQPGAPVDLGPPDVHLPTPTFTTAGAVGAGLDAYAEGIYGMTRANGESDQALRERIRLLLMTYPGSVFNEVGASVASYGMPWTGGSTMNYSSLEFTTVGPDGKSITVYATPECIKVGPTPGKDSFKKRRTAWDIVLEDDED